VARLVRALHELTAGTELAGDAEVVCHNDLSPKNTVYRDEVAGLRPVAFVDWDLAAPGRRIHDGAHVCWQYLDLGPGVSDPLLAGRRVRLVADAYGLRDRGALVDTVLWWQDRCWRGIGTAADAGDPAMVRLRDSGVADRMRAAYGPRTGGRPSIRPCSGGPSRSASTSAAAREPAPCRGTPRAARP
jgi:hypothetical protein